MPSFLILFGKDMNAGIRTATILTGVMSMLLVFTSEGQTPGLDWAKSAGSPTSDKGWSVTTDGAGNVYATGEFSGTVDFDPGAGIFNLTSAGTQDIFILKLDVNGNFVWAKAMGGVGNDWGLSIKVDASGNVYTIGQFSATANFDPGASDFSLTSVQAFDIFICKLDISGNFVWAKAMGGSVDDYGFSIALDGSGNIYATGSFGTTVDFDPDLSGVFNLVSAGGLDIFVLKLDGSGNFMWAKAMGGTGDDEGYSIAIDASSNVHTTGYFNSSVDFNPGAGNYVLSSAGLLDIFISKFDGAGNFVWAQAMGGTGEDFGNAIVLDASGNVFTTGGFSTTADFNPGAGNFNLISSEDYDAFISKLDPSGNLIFAKAIQGQRDDTGNSIALDASGNIYTTGKFTNADFDPGVGVYQLSSDDGDEDIFISKLDGNGNFAWAIKLGWINSDNGYSITVDIAGKVVTTGFFDHTTNFDPSSCTSNLTAFGNTDIFIQKINQDFPPAITGFAPVSGPIGTTVIITGTNFSAVAANNTVLFNGVSAIVTSSTTTSITTTVPTGAITGMIMVSVGCRIVTSTSPFSIGSSCLPISERNALIALYNSTNGVGWNNKANWLTADESTWFGVTVSSCHVTDIVLPFNNMAGPIPSGIKDLTELQQLNLHDNLLNGTIPKELGSLVKLKILWFNWNNFTGSIPTELGNLIQITSIDICCNQLTGSIPKELGNLIQAQSFKLQLNQLSGNVPVELANLTSVGVFDIGYNNLTGAVANYPALQQIFIQGNRISDIPPFTSPAIFQLQVQDNYLTFEDLEPNIGKTGFIYSPQAILPGGAVSATAGSTLTVPFTTGGTQNIYQWYKEGVLIPGATTKQFTIPNVQLSDAGDYTVKVTNTLVTGLTLLSNPFIVTITDQPPIISTTSITTVVNGKVTLSLAGLISDPDNNLDLSTLKIVKQPTSGAIASIGPNSMLSLDYTGKLFAGKDEFTIEVCDLAGLCTQQILAVYVNGEIIINNGISPNGNGQNDIWIIQYIDVLPDTKSNKVTLFNRWGDVVFETINYDNTNNVFKGINKNGSDLPTGTYFYKIEFTSGKKTETGYLSLKR